MQFGTFYGLYLLLLLLAVLVNGHESRVVQLYLLAVCGLVGVSI